MMASSVWLYVGLTAQGLFGIRFLLQWIASERQKKSVIPVAFWYVSIAAGAMLLAYATYKQEVVFMVGEAFSLLVFIRNLILVRKHGPSDH